jgi:thioredoxin 1
MFGNSLKTTLFIAVLSLGLLPAAWGQGPPPRETRPTILEFGRETCPICKRMEQVMARLKKDYGAQVQVRLLYVEKHEHLYRRYGIVIIPTQVFLDASGKEVFRHEGEISREGLVKKLKELKFINWRKDKKNSKISLLCVLKNPPVRTK